MIIGQAANDVVNGLLWAAASSSLVATRHSAAAQK
jgi:hypothetical protein